MENLKKAAAEEAVKYVKSGMVVGLGTGSTTYFAIKKIGELIKGKELTDIIGIPSSVQSEELSKRFNIPLTTFDKYTEIDITIDGADEVDENLNLIKGGGGALLREKVLAQATKKEIIIVDESKLSEVLGTKWAVPIEIIRFALNVESKFLESIGGKPKLRISENNKPFITDEGNYILDTNFGKIENPEILAQQIENRAGIVEHGLFIHLTSEVIVATNEGIKKIVRNSA